MTVAAEAVVERVGAPKARRQALAGAGLVSAATLGAGVLIYAFHVLAARRLGPDAYGQIAVLWASLFLVVIVLFRPLEQTMSRETADRLARGEEVGTVISAVARLATAITAALALGIGLAWPTISDRLFLGNDLMTAMLLAGIVLYGGAYVIRGLLAGVRWFQGYGIGLIADSFVRLLVAAPLVFFASQDLAATAIAAAALGGLAVPLLVGRKRLRSLTSGTSTGGFELRSAVGFALPVGVVAGADQLLVNGGPLLVMLSGGAGASKAAGVVFAATMLVRVPVYLFQGLAASLLPNLTHLHAVSGSRRFRRAVQQTALLLLAGGALIVAAAAVAGPEGMAILYGDEFTAGRLELVLLASGVACYLAAATFSQALLALGAAGRAAIGWSAAAACFVGAYAVTPGEPLVRIAIAFLVATAVALLGLAAALLRIDRA